MSLVSRGSATIIRFSPAAEPKERSEKQASPLLSRGSPSTQKTTQTWLAERCIAFTEAVVCLAGTTAPV